jgi:hypothetical protein
MLCCIQPNGLLSFEEPLGKRVIFVSVYRASVDGL